MNNKVFEKSKKIFSGLITVLGSVFLAIILIIVFAVYSSGHKPLPDNIILKLTLENGLNETEDGSSFPFDFSSDGQQPLAVYSIVNTLKAAGSDKRVKALVLNIKDGDYGYAHIQEIRNAVSALKKSGKPVYVYSNSFGNQGTGMASYYLASAGDEIWMPPMGSLGITGFFSGTPFFKGFFDKVGILPEIIHKGDYKSAPESLMRTEMSRENREMMQSVIGGYYDRFIADVSQSRKTDEKTLRDAVNNAPLSSADALKMHLIDSIGYKDMFIDRVTEKTGDFEWIDIADYNTEESGKNGKYIAIVHVDGLIASESGEGAALGEASVNLQDITSSLEDVAGDGDCAGVVIRINSPGGTPEASDELYRAIEKAGEKKPVTVSMANTAASGGYWIAVNSQYITAMPMTLTGSIGVFGGKISVKGLMDKLGITVDGIKIGENSDIYYPDRSFTPAQEKKISKMMDDVYEAFVERVATGRKIPVEKVRELAKGRVYTGEQAVKVGLVDEIGGLDRAVEKAVEIAGLERSGPIGTVHLPGPRSFFDKIHDVAGEIGFVYSSSIRIFAEQMFSVDGRVVSVAEKRKIY